MVQAADGLASQKSNATKRIETDSQALDSTELATKEDSILALAIGVVFAMTLIQSGKELHQHLMMFFYSVELATAKRHWVVARAEARPSGRLLPSVRHFAPRTIAISGS